MNEQKETQLIFIEKQEHLMQLEFDALDLNLSECEVREAERMVELIKLQHDLIYQSWFSQYIWMANEIKALREQIEGSE